ncbi:hypothetical protein FRC20_006988 [Serendipita sp. 405]|nr:hypothetical protein FRC20_006988 [Serendipita sp. 405]
MASPSLFDSVYIGPSEYSKQEFINAELGENNPIWSIIKEKEQLYRKEGNWPPPEIGIMVSIGCGKEEVISIETGEKQPRQGMLAHFNPFGAVDEQADSEQVLYNVMLRIAKDCERKHQDIKSRLSKEDEHKYFRLNVEQGMQRISETDWSQQNMQNITAHVNYYKDDTEVDEMMGNAAAALARLCEKPVEPQIPAWRTTLKAQPTT